MLFRDKLIVNGDASTATEIEMGCAFDYSDKMFNKEAPYFAGLSWQPGSLISQLNSAGIIDDSFGLCMGDAGVVVPNSTNRSASDGVLVLGYSPIPSSVKVKNSYSTTLIDTAAWNSKYGANLFEGPWLELSS